jgi:hypothetical protein
VQKLELSSRLAASKQEMINKFMSEFDSSFQKDIDDSAPKRNEVSMRRNTYGSF